MGVLVSVGQAIERVDAVGGTLRLEGEKVKLRLPGHCRDANAIAAMIRQNAEAVRQMLADQQSRPPSLEEVKALLPLDVSVVSYEPKQTPFAVAQVSVVTNAGKFFRAYLTDLAWRLKNPLGHGAPPLTDIVTKLADAGLILTADGDSGFLGAAGARR